MKGGGWGGGEGVLGVIRVTFLMTIFLNPSWSFLCSFWCQLGFSLDSKLAFFFFFSWFNFASFCFKFVQVVLMLIQVDSKWLQVVFNLHQIENNFGLNVMYTFMYKYLLINVYND